MKKFLCKTNILCKVLLTFCDKVSTFPTENKKLARVLLIYLRSTARYCDKTARRGEECAMA